MCYPYQYEDRKHLKKRSMVRDDVKRGLTFPEIARRHRISIYQAEDLNKEAEARERGETAVKPKQVETLPTPLQICSAPEKTDVGVGTLPAKPDEIALQICSAAEAGLETDEQITTAIQTAIDNSHPAANLLPLEIDELRRLAQSIREHGQQQPIVMHEGKILDGRSRAIACQIIGVDECTVEFKDIANGRSPEEFVLIANIDRRHLTTAQRATIAAQIAETLPDRCGKGLQKLNTSSCADVFLHDKNDITWGWSPDYLAALKAKLPNGEKLSLYHMAVWLYKDRAWSDNATRSKVLQEIIKEYNITKQESQALFELEIKSSLSEAQAFQDIPVKWHQLLVGYTQPKDVPPEQSGILSYLGTEHLGVVDQLTFEPAKRLNIITGDNGLGKTFLLDLAWWALTQDWPDRPAWPLAFNLGKSPSIKFVVSGGLNSKPVSAHFEPTAMDWQLDSKSPSISGLVIYARVDGSFAVWDPANKILSGPTTHRWPGVKFTREQVWSGKEEKIEGLIRDWVRWQERRDKYAAYDTFCAVLKRMSPPDLGELLPGEPVRLPGISKEIPTLTPVTRPHTRPTPDPAHWPRFSPFGAEKRNAKRNRHGSAPNPKKSLSNSQILW